MFRYSLALGYSLISVAAGWSHYNMLLPDTAMAQKGEKVGFVYQFGHPFEHELIDAPAADQGTRDDCPTAKGRFDEDPGEIQETRRRRQGGDGLCFDFTPEQRGDHWFVLTTPPIWIEESKEFVRTRSGVLHVQTQNGWEMTPGKQMQICAWPR